MGFLMSYKLLKSKSVNGKNLENPVWKNGLSGHRPKLSYLNISNLFSSRVQTAKVGHVEYLDHFRDFRKLVYVNYDVILVTMDI